jgi:pimeloyl-ACP methyl ester carboxylesterase
MSPHPACNADARCLGRRHFLALAAASIAVITAGCVAAPAPGAGGGGSAGGETYWVENPSTGVQLYVEVLRPDGATSALPMVVMVPGGRSDSTLFTSGANTAQRLADGGYVVVVFDPDGRGQSGGVEDDGGSDQQDGLAAVIEFAVTLDGVDPDRVAVTTNSFGVTIGTGALARHPALPVDVLIDWEGPADRDDTGGCDGTGPGGHLDGACDDESYWGEREASTFVAQIDVPYVRLQSETDHVQPDAHHALVMVNAAINGGVPHVQLNDLVVTAELSEIPEGALLSDSTDRSVAEMYAQYLDALLP